MTNPHDPDAPVPNPYAGRWVALVRGRVVAHGSTPDQARRAAKHTRPKETPEICFMPFHDSPFTTPLLESIRAVLPDGLPVYLVGGAVRDTLLRRPTHDLDFVVPTGAIALARQVANRLDAAFYPLDLNTDTGRVVIINDDGSRDVLDFAAFRGPDLEADLRARDFTSNALALNLADHSLIDPLNGVRDLREKRLCACSAHTFTQDPVRILRAVRQAAALGFTIQLETRQMMKESVALLHRVSPERKRDELFKILEGPRPSTSLRALDILGVLPHLLPELPAMKSVTQSPPHVHEVWTHTLRVLDHLESTLAALAPGYAADSTNDLLTGLLTLRLGRYRPQIAAHFAEPLNADRSPRALLFLAALYHDVAKPLLRTVEPGGRIRFLGHDERGADIAAERARALALSNDEIARLKVIIRHHMRIHAFSDRLAEEKAEPSRKAVYRFFRDTGAAGVDLCLLAMADQRATYDHTLPQENWAACLDACRALLENWWEKREETVAPPILINGHELMTALGLPPGRQVGRVLDALREAQAVGEIATRDEALTFARNWIAKQ